MHSNFLWRKWIVVFLLFSNFLMPHLEARIGILHVSFAQWCLGDPWFTAESCNMSLFNCLWMRSSNEMCYIFSSLVNTVWGAGKDYLKHQEVKSKRLQSVGWKQVVYFFIVRLREKNLQFSRGTIMIQVQTVSVLFPVAKYWLCLVAADGLNGECNFAGRIERVYERQLVLPVPSGPGCYIKLPH